MYPTIRFGQAILDQRVRDYLPRPHRLLRLGRNH